MFSIPSCRDTAHRVHPLAGQGVSLGLGDVATLTSCLLKASSRGTDWGRYTTFIHAYLSSVMQLDSHKALCMEYRVCRLV